MPNTGAVSNSTVVYCYKVVIAACLFLRRGFQSYEFHKGIASYFR